MTYNWNNKIGNQIIVKRCCQINLYTGMVTAWSRLQMSKSVHKGFQLSKMFITVLSKLIKIMRKRLMEQSEQDLMITVA